jgi:hypothetical protein
VGILHNVENASPAVQAVTSGTGNAITAIIENLTNPGHAVSAVAVGSGAVMFGSDGGYGTGPGLALNLINPANTQPVVEATTAGTGDAVKGTISNAKSGAAAMSAMTSGTGNAVQATISNSANTFAAILGTTSGTGAGVKGTTGNAAGTGVIGQGTKGATGVEGESDTGTGVLAKSTSGDALKVVGKVAFSRSGLATVAAGKKSVPVTLAGVTTSSLIIATLQTAAGAIAVANAIPASGSFTINLTAAPTSAVKVAWFVIG